MWMFLLVFGFMKNKRADKNLDFSTGRVFVQCDKSENTKLSILIKYILNSSVYSSG